MQPHRLQVPSAGCREQRICERASDARLPLVHVGVAALVTGGDEHDALARLANGHEQGVDLVALGEAAGDRLAVDAAVRVREARREPRCAHIDRFAHELAHALNLVGCGGALVRRVTQHVEPQRRMADVSREVERGPESADSCQVLRERLEVPRDARVEGSGIHVLDVLERAHDRVALLRASRSDREPAVAGDDGRDPLVRRGAERRVPEDLRVVVGVDIDEARCDGATRCVEHADALEVRADLGDHTVRDSNVGHPSRSAGPVEHRSSADHDVSRHQDSPLVHRS